MKKENDNTSSREAKNQADNTAQKFFVNNAGIKLVSVIIAVIVWAVIINIDDPYKTGLLMLKLKQLMKVH